MSLVQWFQRKCILKIQSWSPVKLFPFSFFIFPYSGDFAILTPYAPFLRAPNGTKIAKSPQYWKRKKETGNNFTGVVFLLLISNMQIKVHNIGLYHAHFGSAQCSFALIRWCTRRFCVFIISSDHDTCHNLRGRKNWMWKVASHHYCNFGYSQHTRCHSNTNGISPHLPNPY